MPVAVVTDSTAYLPPDLAGTLTTVPLTVVLGSRQGREGIEITAADVAGALRANVQPVTTSRPAPAEFLAVYRRLLDEGFAGVLSVHLSASLSGTVAAATLAAERFPGRVRVVDAGSVGMGLGFAALAAVASAAAGDPLTAVHAAAVAAVTRTTTLFCVDTLEHLRRGGRIGAAATLLGTALAVKPILRVTGAGIVVSDRARTGSRALARLVDLA
ncbi:MAG: DegV family protein, partial [Dactylosporangium sp.]|nr:DegV family protein [Dactylosporangium sp.]NNJ61358.1 DegV family protein [Dactylosporangium sp.]